MQDLTFMNVLSSVNIRNENTDRVKTPQEKYLDRVWLLC